MCVRSCVRVCWLIVLAPAFNYTSEQSVSAFHIADSFIPFVIIRSNEEEKKLYILFHKAALQNTNFVSTRTHAHTQTFIFTTTSTVKVLHTCYAKVARFVISRYHNKTKSYRLSSSIVRR